MSTKIKFNPLVNKKFDFVRKTVRWPDITDKPLSYPPDPHTHVQEISLVTANVQSIRTIFVHKRENYQLTVETGYDCTITISDEDGKKVEDATFIEITGGNNISIAAENASAVICGNSLSNYDYTKKNLISIICTDNNSSAPVYWVEHQINEY